ncbi:hypothetical protein CAP36_16060 [Chitinophagaceae bacterium IBVUCB2]|nr:hypothetical protein CAP36_16060 [Chitinophagaceae bacterium IBVUCB2]
MQKVIDILGIVLPALIIILGIIRVFVQKTKGVNGLTMLFAILLLLVGLTRYFVYPGNNRSKDNEPKPLPLAVSKHSNAFNQSLQQVLEKYYELTAAFTKADTAAIDQSAATLKIALDSFKIDELNVDTLIYQTALQPYQNAKAAITSIIAGASIAEKRTSFNILSNELFTLLSTARYDLAKLYWQECGTAFGDDAPPGNWISPVEKSANPYTGKDDCAEIKTSINFVAADTTKKL